MLIIHLMCRCKLCHKEFEVFYDEVKDSDVSCPYCMYLNNMNDVECEFWEMEW